MYILLARESPMIASLLNVSKSYDSAEGRIAVLNDVSLEIDGGQTVALTGESGSGKSTLLHLLGGLDKPDQGAITVEGVDLAALNENGRADYRRRRVGLIFQQFNLIPSLDVAANLAFHARLAGRHDPEWQNALADRLGLQELLKRYPEQLSGGQQQRVAIGRTLAARPPLVLADEPTGNLDETTGDTVLSMMLSLVEQTGAALLMVTHSLRLAKRLDRQVHLRNGRVS